ncbi:MAG: hypothetical protein HQL22_05815 [Candidatus Omnitrophica bacterium]|nr:hypothetical protein [Candidatus Omnitrophota bacterium]
MSIEFFRKLNWAFGLIALGALFGLVAFSATLEIKDLDLWLHLKMGEYIVQHGFVPSFDVLSASFFGKPWVNHEWLFQVLVYLVRQGWGIDGLIYMQVGVVLLTFLIMLVLVYNKDRQLLYVPILFLVLQVYQTRFTIRPDIFSLFFFIVYIFILSMYLNRRWSVWVLFALQVIWTNMHGYSLWGIIFVLIGLSAEIIKRGVPLPYEWKLVGRLTDDEYQRLWLIAGALIAAMFFNPLGLEGVLYPLRTLLGLSGDSRIFFSHITELQRPLAWKTLFDVDSMWPYKSLIMLSFISFIFNRRKIDISALMLWVVFLLFSLGAVRNLTYFAFTAFLVIGYNLAEVRFKDVVPLRFRGQQFFFVTGSVITILITLKLIDYGNGIATNGYYDFDKYQRKSEFLGISQRNFPGQAVQFLVDNKIKGNFFNDFNSGAYLIGRAYPNVMVYMDGRTELRGAAFFKEYQKIWNDGDSKTFEDIVQRYHLTGAFINTSAATAPDKVLKMFAAKPEWKPVYFDYDAIIFLKEVPANQAWIGKFALDFASWKPKELNLQTLGPAKVVPYRYLRRAQALYDMGYWEPARLEAEAAIRVLPNYDEAFKILGDVAAKSGQHLKAFEYYRLACAYDNGNLDARKGLAFAYMELNNPAKAVEQARVAMDIDPKNTEARYILAKALVKNKQYAEGYDILKPILSGKKEKAEYKERVEVLLNAIQSNVGKK